MTLNSEETANKRRSIEIVDYDRDWPAAFDRVQANLGRILSGLIVEIDHIGSTSVPGLCAKPKIDIDIVVRSHDVIADAIERLKAKGYVYHGDKYQDGMWAFNMGHGSYGERLYLCVPATPMHLRRLLFRDYLRNHPDRAETYGMLKRKLASKANDDWTFYTGGKASFVAETVRQAVISRIETVPSDKGRICREVLADLPAWFGIPAAVDAYVDAAEELAMVACLAPDGSAIGFASLKIQTTFAVEIHVMGVSTPWHRSGIGRALIDEAQKVARGWKAQFLTVKTIAPSSVDPNYAATRRFYEAVGFVPIEEFPDLWSKNNPCLLMLLPLR